MRLPLLLPFALAALASAPALAADSTPAATGPRVPFKPRAWSPPPAVAAAHTTSAMTEGLPADAGAPGPSRAQALSRVVVEMKPDGSRHAVLGGAIRAWSVASVDEHGQLRLECVNSEAAAKARAHTAGTRGGN
jgi:hypothetical protein